MKIKLTISILGALIAACCFRCSQEVKTEDNYVVQGYLYSNEAIRDIRITQVIPVASTDTIAPVIEGANVQIMKAGKNYQLQFNQPSGNYIYAGSDLEVKPGDLFEIRVVNKSRSASATTVVPEATKGLRISSDKIHIPQIPLNNTTRDLIIALFANARIRVNWDNPDYQLHFISVESLDPFDPIFPQNFPSGVINLFRTFRYVSAPNRLDTYEIVGLSLESYGRYRIKVYRVNKEYADLYDNQAQDSRDLNQPPSNMKNAFGIFSAFASDSAFFQVVRN